MLSGVGIGVVILIVVTVDGGMVTSVLYTTWVPMETLLLVLEGVG